jgi:hypothetical protein
MYDVEISGFTRIYIYIYDISKLRVKIIRVRKMSVGANYASKYGMPAYIIFVIVYKNSWNILLECKYYSKPPVQPQH